ncbi:MAG: sigma-70 family RNA polymerase sigma factor [Chroococcidiopsidaceae cyanobacterium CP_BM_ER_R8_30]|nr:sigma-70 family RNA polymerase sigma factor [Chroococcidiopsidaceae cyanobacterium CP_BM_ER_R8_30]
MASTQPESPKSIPKQFVEDYLLEDSQACEQLLLDQAHQRRIERIARKQTRGSGIAWEDAAQTAHEKVLQAVREGRFAHGGVKEFYHWAATVAYYRIIDLVRKEKRQQVLLCCQSLDELIPGTDITLSETISDKFDSWQVLERADLVAKAVAAIATIDQRYPSKGYLKLWQNWLQDKTQLQLATELGVTQGEISKRWQKLLALVATELGLLQIKNVKRELHKIRQTTTSSSHHCNANW